MKTVILVLALCLLTPIGRLTPGTAQGQYSDLVARGVVDSTVLLARADMSSLIDSILTARQVACIRIDTVESFDWGLYYQTIDTVIVPCVQEEE